MTPIPQLSAEYDCLRTPDGLLLLCLYSAGDCDSIPFPPSSATYWTPREWASKLRSALYDAREMGRLPYDATQVRLPDGSIFAIEQSYEDYCADDEFFAEQEFLAAHPEARGRL